jgi:PA domain
MVFQYFITPKSNKILRGCSRAKGGIKTTSTLSKVGHSTTVLTKIKKRKKMIKYLTIALFLLMAASTSQAQSQRSDTMTLAVFNTARNFMVTSADFGSDLTQDLIGTMVMAFDTIMVLKEHTVKDSSNKKPLRYQMERSATKLSDVKGKIALIDYNKDYDVTQMCLNAQRGGAIAIVIIHESSDKKLYKLIKKGIYKDSIRIPCFTIPNNKGEYIIQLLPSVIGIKAPVLPPVRPQQLVAPTDSSAARALATNKTTDKVPQNAEMDEDGETVNGKTTPNSVRFSKRAFTLSPNPSHSQTTLTYQFSQPTDVTLYIETIAGQVIQRQLLRGVTVGSVDISTSEWANGTYILSMQYGKEIKTKKFEVQH